MMPNFYQHDTCTQTVFSEKNNCKRESVLSSELFRIEFALFMYGYCVSNADPGTAQQVLCKMEVQSQTVNICIDFEG